MKPAPREAGLAEEVFYSGEGSVRIQQYVIEGYMEDRLGARWVQRGETFNDRRKARAFFFSSVENQPDCLFRARMRTITENSHVYDWKTPDAQPVPSEDD